MTEKEIMLFLFLILLHYFDVMTTYYAIVFLGFYELNPLMSYLVYNDFYFLLLILKIILIICMLKVWGNKKIYILIIMSIYFSFIVIRNYLVIINEVI